MDELKRVEITWIDAKSWSNAWIDTEELNELVLPEYVSCGYVVKETEFSIFLAQTKGDEYRNIIGINKGCITNRSD